jgi:hypothetical protein
MTAALVEGPVPIISFSSRHSTLKRRLAVLHGDELHLGGRPHAHGRRRHMAEIDMGAHGLLPLPRKGFRASMQVASTKPTMPAVTSIGGMSLSGSAGTMTLGSTIRDRLWVSSACGPPAVILSLSHARPRIRPL